MPRVSTYPKKKHPVSSAPLYRYTITVRPTYNTTRPLYTWLLITTYTVGAVGGTPGYMGRVISGTKYYTALASIRTDD